jgi:hypothetical protein
MPLNFFLAPTVVEPINMVDVGSITTIKTQAFNIVTLLILLAFTVKYVLPFLKEIFTVKANKEIEQLKIQVELLQTSLLTVMTKLDKHNDTVVELLKDVSNKLKGK